MKLSAVILSVFIFSSLGLARNKDSAKLQFETGNVAHPSVGYDIQLSGGNITGQIIGFPGAKINLAKDSKGRWQGFIGNTKVHQGSSVISEVAPVGYAFKVLFGATDINCDESLPDYQLANGCRYYHLVGTNTSVGADALEVSNNGQNIQMQGLTLYQAKPGLYAGTNADPNTTLNATLEVSGIFPPMVLANKDAALFLLLNVFMIGGDQVDDQVGIVH